MAADQRIAYPDDPLMAVAWLSFVSWAARHRETLAAYEADTGKRLVFSRPRSPIDRMIDEATGYERESMESFVDWVNAELWGEDPFAAKSAPEV